LLTLLRVADTISSVRNKRRSVVSVALAALVFIVWPLAALANTLVPLATAGNYAVIGGTTITNTGPTWITGELALSPGTAVTGFPPGVSGHKDVTNAAAGQAQSDLTNAYNNAAGQTPFVTISGNIGGRTLVAGTYRTTGGLTGTLTLDGQGSTGGVWIFQQPSTLITATSSRVHLINGAQPCDVFWQVGSSATIGVSTTFVGNILALTSIAMQTGATLNGRALARNGAVTLDTNRIIQSSGCGYGAPAFVAPPTGNVLPATLGIPLELRGEIPWLLVVGIGAGMAMGALGFSSLRRRRRTV
jgi:hypothetical protein